MLLCCCLIITVCSIFVLICVYSIARTGCYMGPNGPDATILEYYILWVWVQVWGIKYIHLYLLALRHEYWFFISFFKSLLNTLVTLSVCLSLWIYIKYPNNSVCLSVSLCLSLSLFVSLSPWVLKMLSIHLHLLRYDRNIYILLIYFKYPNNYVRLSLSVCFSSLLFSLLLLVRLSTLLLMLLLVCGANCPSHCFIAFLRSATVHV